MRTLQILAVPNEDGWGPSALTSYLVREFLRSEEPRCEVTIWNRNAASFNRALFHGEPRVKVVEVDNIIALAKRDGMPSIPETLARLAEYRRRSDEYPGARADGRFDLVLDFGVPAAARWASRRGMRSVSVFDHSWSKTFELILADGCASDVRLVEEIREDERHTQSLYLFPRFITPDVFYRHWRALGVEPQDIGAVLGGNPRESCPSGILIQAGDTPAWDPVMPALVGGLAKLDDRGELDVDVMINVPGRFQESFGRVFADPGRKRLRELGPPQGGTIQEILPAVALMITRAGGGSVNDAVACRVPFVCIEEPGQSQVRAVLEACEERGLTKRVSWDAFRSDPVGVCRSLWREDVDRGVLARLREIPFGGERRIVREMLERGA